MAFPTGWGRKCAVTIGAAQVSGAGALTDFSFLCTVDNLPSEMFDADGTYPALSGGGDIRFSSDSAGTTQLAIDVVVFTINNNPALGTAEIWVNAASITDSDVFYVWYDKTGETQPVPSDTYGSESVWLDYWVAAHLTESASDTALHYVNLGTGANGTGSSMSLSNVAGPFTSTVAQFDGTADLIDFPTAFGATDDVYTLQAWANPDSLAEDQRAVSIAEDGGANSTSTGLIWMDAGGTGDGWRAQGNPASGAFVVYGLDSSNDASASTWVKLSHKWGVSTGNIYVDSTETSGLASGNFSDGTNDPDVTRVGRAFELTGTSAYFNGGLAEIRLRLDELSSDWLATEYNSQSAPGTFASAGTPETPVGPTGRIMSSLAASGGLAYHGGIAGPGGGLAG